MPWSRTSRHERGYGTAHDRARKHLLATEPLCRLCRAKGLTTLAMIADHIKPLSQGGTGEMSNYQPLCQTCSDKKTTTERGGTYRPKVRYGLDGWPTQAR